MYGPRCDVIPYQHRFWEGVQDASPQILISQLKIGQLGDFEGQGSLADINGLPGCTMVATEIPGEWSVPIWDFHAA